MYLRGSPKTGEKPHENPNVNEARKTQSKILGFENFEELWYVEGETDLIKG